MKFRNLPVIPGGFPVSDDWVIEMTAAGLEIFVAHRGTPGDTGGDAGRKY